MCGIAGVLIGAERPPDQVRSQVLAMTRAIAHRGPDHEATWVSADGRVGLGYRRLAIIDLSADGNQPLISGSGALVLVFNGEIYNYLEIRQELTSLGVTFRGHSDTEVLLAAIELWGLPAALDRAVGMFAFSVWDARENCLWLARDRVGKKPLYYADTPQGFFFASEIKALRDGARLPLSRNDEALQHYLTLGFVPGPRTAYREIQEVPPGCWARVVPGKPPTLTRYWTLPAPDEDGQAGEPEQQLDALLVTAVKQRLRADVDVGLFLSGGIDSGILAAVLAREHSRTVKAFTVAFDDRAYDETARATAIAAQCGVEHEILRLEPDVRDFLPQIAAAYDEPFGDPSAVPTFAIARAASQQLKVILTGEGADELFGGYRRHLAIHNFARIADTATRVPWIVGLAKALPEPNGFRTAYSFFHRVARGISDSPSGRYISWSSDGFTETDKNRLMPDASAPSTASTIAADAAWPLDRGLTGDFMALDFTCGLADCLLVKMDIATMAHGLEARSPYLDHRLVEWVARLPRRVLFADRGTKPLLRRLARKVLPAAVAAAPKQGFEIPLIRWTNHEFYPLIHDVCLAPNGLLVSMMDKRELRDFLEHRWTMSAERWSKCAWILLMLAMWDQTCKSVETEALCTYS